jgi:glycosyltransferase involved in cell wall biosynthesis
VQDPLRRVGATIVDLDVVRRDIRPWWDAWGAYRLARFLRQARYAIVHTSTSKGGFVGRLSARLAGVPVIIHTVAGFAFHEHSSTLQLHTFATLERMAAHWCDRIVTVSHFHRDWALRLGIGDQVLLKAIPSGIPQERVALSRPPEQTRSLLGLTPGHLTVLFTGRLAEQKGLEYLISAVPLLARRLDGAVKVLLAGDGPLKADLSSLAKRLGVEDHVVFLGFQTDIGDLLAVSDVFALPSPWEGLSISVLEAMAASKPIVATSIGSNRELLQDGATGLLVPPKRADMLGRAILALAEDGQLRHRLGAAAHRVFRENYTEERMVGQYESEYIALCRRKGVPL